MLIQSCIFNSLQYITRRRKSFPDCTWANEVNMRPEIEKPGRANTHAKEILKDDFQWRGNCARDLASTHHKECFNWREEKMKLSGNIVWLCHTHRGTPFINQHNGFPFYPFHPFGAGEFWISKPTHTAEVIGCWFYMPPSYKNPAFESVCVCVRVCVCALFTVLFSFN